jgi:hypothetical protein
MHGYVENMWINFVSLGASHENLKFENYLSSSEATINAGKKKP